MWTATRVKSEAGFQDTPFQTFQLLTLLASSMLVDFPMGLNKLKKKILVIIDKTHMSWEIFGQSEFTCMPSLYNLAYHQ